jgi:hypothetical protein
MARAGKQLSPRDREREEAVRGHIAGILSSKPKAVEETYALKSRPRAIIREVLRRMLHRPDAAVHLVGDPFPAAISAFQKIAPTIFTQNLAAEINWATEIVACYGDRLSEFISRKEAYERALLGQDLNSVDGILDDIRQKFGWSLWGIEQNLLKAEIQGGLEANKRALASVYDKTEDVVTRTLSNFFSDRAESKLSASAYNSFVNSFFQQLTDEDSRVRMVIAYFRLRINFNSAGDFSQLAPYLWYESRYSVADYYLCLVRVLIVLLADTRLSSNVELAILRSITRLQ